MGNLGFFKTPPVLIVEDPHHSIYNWIRKPTFYKMLHHVLKMHDWCICSEKKTSWLPVERLTQRHCRSSLCPHLSSVYSHLWSHKQLFACFVFPNPKKNTNGTSKYGRRNTVNSKQSSKPEDLTWKLPSSLQNFNRAVGKWLPTQPLNPRCPLSPSPSTDSLHFCRGTDGNLRNQKRGSCLKTKFQMLHGWQIFVHPPIIMEVKKWVCLQE